MLQRLHTFKNSSSETGSSSPSPVSDIQERPFKRFVKSTQDDETMDVESSQDPKFVGRTTENADKPSSTEVASQESSSRLLPSVENVSAGGDGPSGKDRIDEHKLPTDQMNSAASEEARLNTSGNVESKHTSKDVSASAGSSRDKTPAGKRTKRSKSSKGKSSLPRGKGRPKVKGYDPERSRKLSDTEVELSNSSWAEMSQYIIGSQCMYPLNPIMQQRFILQYLTPLGEYQEVSGHL